MTGSGRLAVLAVLSGLSVGPGATAQDAALFGWWQPVSPNLPSAAQAEAATRAGGNECLFFGMPLLLTGSRPLELIDQGERIIIRYAGTQSPERVVYLRPGSGPAVQPPSPLGVSFGRWEGPTLAIFTLYIDYPVADLAGTPQSSEATVLERYTIEPDTRRLSWEASITDPGYGGRVTRLAGSMQPVREGPDLPAATACAEPAARPG